MKKESDLIVVRNRNNGTTGYTIPDTRVRRFFAANESKKIPFSELQQLQYIPGGDYILKNLLVIEDAEAVAQLNMKVEPEYYYTEDVIRTLLIQEGSIDQMEDFINFAPAGALEIAKQIAVSEEIPDMRKRKLLADKTGFNINAAIELNHQMNEPDVKEDNAADEPTRKAAPIQGAPEAPARKAAPLTTAVSKPATTNYKVVSKQ